MTEFKHFEFYLQLINQTLKFQKEEFKSVLNLPNLKALTPSAFCEAQQKMNVLSEKGEKFLSQFMQLKEKKRKLA
jgi:hypothetical protein